MAITKLGTLLVQKGLITPAQLESGLKAQLIYGGRLGTNLVELEVLDLDDMTRVLAEQRHFPLAQPKDFESTSEETLALIKPELAQKHECFPFARDGRRLKVAMTSPWDDERIQAISFITGLRVMPHIVPEMRLFFYQERRYGIKRDARYIRLAPERKTLPEDVQVERRSFTTPDERKASSEFGGLQPGQFLSGDDEPQQGSSTPRARPVASPMAGPGALRAAQVAQAPAQEPTRPTAPTPWPTTAPQQPRVPPGMVPAGGVGPRGPAGPPGLVAKAPPGAEQPLWQAGPKQGAPVIGAPGGRPPQMAGPPPGWRPPPGYTGPLPPGYPGAQQGRPGAAPPPGYAAGQPGQGAVSPQQRGGPPGHPGSHQGQPGAAPPGYPGAQQRPPGRMPPGYVGVQPGAPPGYAGATQGHPGAMSPEHPAGGRPQSPTPPQGDGTADASGPHPGSTAAGTPPRTEVSGDPRTQGGPPSAASSTRADPDDWGNALQSPAATPPPAAANATPRDDSDEVVFELGDEDVAAPASEEATNAAQPVSGTAEVFASVEPGPSASANDAAASLAGMEPAPAEAFAAASTPEATTAGVAPPAAPAEPVATQVAVEAESASPVEPAVGLENPSAGDAPVSERTDAPEVNGGTGAPAAQGALSADGATPDAASTNAGVGSAPDASAAAAAGGEADRAATAEQNATAAAQTDGAGASHERATTAARTEAADASQENTTTASQTDGASTSSENAPVSAEADGSSRAHEGSTAAAATEDASAVQAPAGADVTSTPQDSAAVSAEPDVASTSQQSATAAEGTELPTASGERLADEAQAEAAFTAQQGPTANDDTVASQQNAANAAESAGTSTEDRVTAPTEQGSEAKRAEPAAAAESEAAARQAAPDTTEQTGSEPPSDEGRASAGDDRSSAAASRSDASETDSGTAADTSAAHTSAVDTSAVDTSAVDTSVAEPQVVGGEVSFDNAAAAPGSGDESMELASNWEFVEPGNADRWGGRGIDLDAPAADAEPALADTWEYIGFSPTDGRSAPERTPKEVVMSALEHASQSPDIALALMQYAEARFTHGYLAVESFGAVLVAVATQGAPVSAAVVRLNVENLSWTADSPPQPGDEARPSDQIFATALGASSERLCIRALRTQQRPFAWFVIDPGSVPMTEEEFSEVAEVSAAAEAAHHRLTS